MPVLAILFGVFHLRQARPMVAERTLAERTLANPTTGGRPSTLYATLNGAPAVIVRLGLGLARDWRPVGASLDRAYNRLDPATHYGTLTVRLAAVDTRSFRRPARRMVRVGGALAMPDPAGLFDLVDDGASNLSAAIRVPLPRVADYARAIDVEYVQSGSRDDRSSGEREATRLRPADAVRRVAR